MSTNYILPSSTDLEVQADEASDPTRRSLIMNTRGSGQSEFLPRDGWEDSEATPQAQIASGDGSTAVIQGPSNVPEYSAEQRALFSRMAGVCEKDRFADVLPFRASYPPEELDTDFKKKYPPDPFGEEMTPNARVWKVFRDEATAQDEAMLDGWNKTLDILLIFAGLFSAVATAFIIESYTSLQPDYQEYTARALFALLSARNGSDFPDAALDLPDPSIASPSVHARWINGLWLTSLFLSLAVSLLSILVKQWLTKYASRLKASSRSLQHWAHRRSRYFRGITRWHLPAFIATLPLLLHLALFLFLVGLVLLLWHLDCVIAMCLLFLTAALCSFYLVCFILPAWQIDCLTSTPLLEQLRRVRHAIPILAYDTFCAMLRAVYRTRSKDLLGQPWSGIKKIGLRAAYLFRASAAFRIRLRRVRTYVRSVREQLLEMSLPRGMGGHYPALVDEGEIYADQEALEVAALQWIVHCCSSPEVIAVAIQASGAVHPSSRTAHLLREVSWSSEWAIPSVSRYLSVCPRDSTEAARHAPEIARFLRAHLCIRGLIVHGPTHLPAWIRGCEHYDLPFLSTLLSVDGKVDGPASLTVMLQRWNHAEGHTNTRRPFSNSTGILALRVASSLQNIVGIIAALDFSQLTYLDADPITRSILIALHRLDHGPHDRCQPYCAVELLSEIVLNPASFGTRKEDISPILQKMVSLWHMTACDIDMPNLLHFLSSDLVLEMPWSPLDIRRLVHIVCCTIRPGEAAHSRQRASELMHLISRMFTLAQRLKKTLYERELWHFQEVASLCAEATYRAFSSPTPAPFSGIPLGHPLSPWTISNPDDAQLRDIQACIFASPLRLLHRVDNEPSAWQVFAEREFHSGSILRTAYILAAQLCAVSRQSGLCVALLAEEFFAPRWGLKALRMIAPERVGVEDGGQHIFEQVVRHCTELKPDWWPSLLFQVRALDSSSHLSQSVKDVAHAIDAKVARGMLGRCRVCPPERAVKVTL